LAGQVAMTTSNSNQDWIFWIAMGTFNLDSIRKYAPNAMVLYSSSNKNYMEILKSWLLKKRKPVIFVKNI
jgi:N-acetylmuramoyl-L-alanine amidase CwlA